MKIVGGLGKSRLGYISAILMVEKFNINAPVRFYVDTGASRTLISDRDALRIGVDYKKLRKAPEKVQGLDGEVDVYLLPKCMLVFSFADCVHIEFLSNIFVLHSGNRTTIPSLLGIDVLKKYSVNFTEKKVIREK
jgi:hypothetical protein